MGRRRRLISWSGAEIKYAGGRGIAPGGASPGGGRKGAIKVLMIRALAVRLNRGPWFTRSPPEEHGQTTRPLGARPCGVRPFPSLGIPMWLGERVGRSPEEGRAGGGRRAARVS